MEPVFGTEYTYKSRTRTWCNEHNSRSSFEDKERSSRLEIMPKDISDYRQDMGTIPLGSLCKPSQFSTPSVFFMDSGSGCGSHQRFSSDMVQNESLGQSSMDLDTEDIIQIDQGKSNNDHTGALVGDSSMVSITPRSINRTSISHSIQEDSSRGTESPNKSFSQPKLEITRLQTFRSRYQAKGFSEKSVDLLMSTLETSSTKTVSSNLRAWISWCRSNSVDPIVCNLNSICEFFSDKLKEGKSYNTIAGYRSAISEVHDKVDGVPIGQHSVITKALLAVYKGNPPLTPSDDLIDISPSLTFIVNLGDNDSMSIRDLSIKTAFLMALVSASRPSDLVRIDATSMKESDNGYSFNCIEPKEFKIAIAHSTTTSKPNVKRIFIGKYPDDSHLCPFLAVQSLLQRTTEWRSNNSKKKSLFLITRSSYTQASVDTVAGWIKSVIQCSSSSATAKDIRATSASLAQKAGIDLATILSLGNWTSNSTYQKFYQRGIRLMLEKNRVSEIILKEASASGDITSIMKDNGC